MQKQILLFNSVSVENLPEGVRFEFKRGDQEVTLWLPQEYTLAALVDLGSYNKLALYECQHSVTEFIEDIPVPENTATLRFGIFTLNDAARTACFSNTTISDIIDYINTTIAPEYRRISTVADKLTIDTHYVPDFGQTLTINLVNVDDHYSSRTHYDLIQVFRTKELVAITPGMLNKRNTDAKLADIFSILKPILSSMSNPPGLVNLFELKAIGQTDIYSSPGCEFYIPIAQDLTQEKLDKLIGEYFYSIKPALKTLQDAI